MIEGLIFYLFAVIAVIAGLGVLLSRQIVRLAYWLIAMLAAVAGLYFLLGAFFLGAIQLIVYVGGVAVLVVFGVMLSSRRSAERMFGSGPELVIAALAGLIVLAGLVVSIFSKHWHVAAEPTSVSMQTLSELLLYQFVGPFELASVLLLIVLLGAAYTARPRVPTAGRKVEDSNDA
jgi:NADH-quinone oxidoreductase subunit J